MLRRFYLVLASFIGVMGPASAETLVESYLAVLSEVDHKNSRGEPLKTAAGIIRQDRANYHLFNRRDLQDEGDRFFANKDNRARLEQMLATKGRSNTALRKIINGTPIVRVNIYKRDNGKHVVRVIVK